MIGTSVMKELKNSISLSWPYVQIIQLWHKTPELLCKSVFLKVPQNSQKSTCARVSFLIKFKVSPATLLQKELWHRCFSVNFAKFWRTPILQNNYRRHFLFMSSVKKYMGRIYLVPLTAYEICFITLV